ncbi:MAG: hypothetical protein HYZ35_06885 [Chloroflexi bacterium]|nr:hypothetical protein [Chloroflexota bacterium]MBI3177698.1 hypothetical protein [Chloroflexota bacterium]
MTTRVEVFAGVCGHSAIIDVTKVDAAHVQVVITSACEQITDMNPDLARVQWKGKGHEVFKRMTESAVYQSAAQHIRHTACPIPTAILKAIEVEVGIALPKDVTITFSSRAAGDAPTGDAYDGGENVGQKEE